MTQTKRNYFWPLTAVLAALAGLVYNSWPLGYWLNLPVAKDGLASGLEALHQPYNWVFIAGDVVSGLLVILVCWLLWRRLSAVRSKRLLDIVLANVVVFGIGTIADTLLPMHCEPSLQHCPSFTVDYFLLFHGLLSIVAAFCLFVSLGLLWWYRRRSLLLGTLLFGYLLFSLFSLFEILGWIAGNWSQHYYLVLCGLWLAALPFAVRAGFAPRNDSPAVSPRRA